MTAMKTDSQATKASLYPEQIIQVIIPETIEPIHTENLYLRRLELTDAPALFEFRRRQDVADWLWPKIPHKHISETEDVIAKKIFKTPDASGVTGRQFSFAVIEANDPSRRVIGAVTINSLVPAPSIGYGIHPDFWGRGYVSEAVGGVIDAWWKLPRKDFHALESSSETEKLFAACNRANIGSVKVLEKNGFLIQREIPLEDDMVALYALERPQR
ncbi:hypothetical protein N7462_007623 [Penicillium macrosclerotiorum]|uniref:uncharacterized protein n=1 Tax=Penicillium macrosclerotiorum TaxID=303699 RepID=UPI002546F47D|nr:uncharacterized protein N7462_007623 [Penicillium macrosclerotiorum]KAJ5679379.1 hypothetical protein N7462_007623 [Penicillium macrosclerotiorum]